jgi:hypothetical protein
VLPPPQGSPGAKHALMDLRFYLEMPWPPTMREQVPQRNDINLFFKYYDWQVCVCVLADGGGGGECGRVVGGGGGMVLVLVGSSGRVQDTWGGAWLQV